MFSSLTRTTEEDDARARVVGVKRARETVEMDRVRETELARAGQPISGMDPIIVGGGQHVAGSEHLLSMEGQTERPRAAHGVTLRWLDHFECFTDLCLPGFDGLEGSDIVLWFRQIDSAFLQIETLMEHRLGFTEIVLEGATYDR